MEKQFVDIPLHQSLHQFIDIMLTDAVKGLQ